MFKVTQWAQEKVQKDKHRSTKHTPHTKDLVRKNSTKTELTQELRKGKSSCSTGDTRCVNLVTNSVLSHE